MCIVFLARKEKYFFRRQGIPLRKVRNNPGRNHSPQELRNLCTTPKMYFIMNEIMNKTIPVSYERIKCIWRIFFETFCIKKPTILKTG